MGGWVVLMLHVDTMLAQPEEHGLFDMQEIVQVGDKAENKNSTVLFCEELFGDVENVFEVFVTSWNITGGKRFLLFGQDACGGVAKGQLCQQESDFGA